MQALKKNINTQHINEVRHILTRAASLAAGLEPTGHAEQHFAEAVRRAKVVNPWFTEEHIAAALTGLAYMLRPEAFAKWMDGYQPAPECRTVGLVLAGNIPLVGFHDILCTIAAGHRAVVKPASQDALLLPALLNWIESVIPASVNKVRWIEGKLGPVDAVIATGTNNTRRYFEYYFAKYPHILRNNRNSLAILTGSESPEELRLLGYDIFSYFGMGCRNVSKLYVHDSFPLERFFEAIYPYHPLVNHHKYANNYDYYRALWLMNREDLLDNGFLILRPSEAIASPVGTLFYERYSDEATLRHKLAGRASEIQCIVSQVDVPFGKSQQPELWDYADGVDTMAFLTAL
jgi:hypothetical protein